MRFSGVGEQGRLGQRYAFTLQHTGIGQPTQSPLTPVIGSVLPVADAAKAHQMLEDLVAFGTVVLRP